MNTRSIIAMILTASVFLPSVAAAEVMYISPYNRRTITTHQPAPNALSPKEQQLKAYQDAEDELIGTKSPDALSKEDVEAIFNEKMGRKPKPAAATAPAEKKPEESGFGAVGGIGQVGGGIGDIGGIGQTGAINSADIDTAE